MLFGMIFVAVGLVVALVLGGMLIGIFNRLAEAARYTARTSATAAGSPHVALTCRPRVQNGAVDAGVGWSPPRVGRPACVWTRMAEAQAPIDPSATHQECDFERLDVALTVLDGTAPTVKRTLLHGVAVCIESDRSVIVNEVELLRAVAVSRGCPMPPLVQTLRAKSTATCSAQ